MKKYKIQTLGCQMNERDSETLAGMLEEKGYIEATEEDKIDDLSIAIINTCSIRENADQRFYGMLGQYKNKKIEDKNFIMCVCGCMMQQEHIVETVNKKFPWVDIIFGTHNIHEFPKLVEDVAVKHKKTMDIWDEAGGIVEHMPSKRLYKYKALVNITFGCNNFCTYCIVPYTRGRERSRSAEEIVKEVEFLAKDGVKEITLLGQNVNSYKGTNGIDFPDLLYMIHDIDGIERIRFMTSHPKDLSDKLINAFSELPKLCNYVHLPIQSGSNNTLKRMNRRYTRESYIEIVRKLREKVPDITISTDIIVGFPGETEEEFEETIELAKEVEFDAAFTFIYSIRKGTPAGEYENQIPEEIKHERFNRLVKIINEKAAKKNREYIDNDEKVLVEGYSKNNREVLTGRTEHNKIVNFVGNKELIGEIVETKILEANTFSLFGKIK